ncbi:serine hydrolase domain-containing protein [Streptomyces sp. Z26]|uniref:serine hydrolase domain-containing protein n=1 Tax=Streptomyces sp. Z26 TaxID=2500177 RepID=UPI000EF134C6|nr:serine hydrolase domain-containing protein [Streptomyces sp. Z26]RLL67742.1 class A beta-lactamase-related serine hydrolase [Streptomyces sp. Z26]
MKTHRTSRVTSRRVVTTLVTALAGISLALPAAGAIDTATTPPHTEANGPGPGKGHGTRHDKALQAHVDALLGTGTVGVVARTTGPHGPRHATAGVADQATGDPVRPGDSFRVASTTKTFVSTVVLQLVGEGRLSLDDTVEHRLPGVVSGNGNDGGGITVRQLLQHTSGLYDYTADLPVLTTRDGYLDGRRTTWSPEQLVAVATKHAPNFEPGDGWSYSNTNYTLAGMIIEKITGHSWQREVTARVIRPLKLRDTVAPTTDPRLPGRHLRGYSAFGDDKAPIDVTEINPSVAGAAGAMISTTADLSRFYQALLGGRLLRPAELAEMKATVRAPELDPAWPGLRYGLGLMEVPLTCGGSYYSHGGDIAGYTTRNGVSEDGRRAVTVNATGDGSKGSATQEAANRLVDDALCG